jgi:hypothetical protein
MASTKTYPVPYWVRVVVCLVPFAMAALTLISCLRTGRGYLLLGSLVTLCAAIAKHALTKT